MRVVGLAQRHGAAKDFAARSFLLKLAERELIQLPPVREYKRSGPQTVGWVKAEFEHTRSHSARSWSKAGLKLDWWKRATRRGEWHFT